MQRELSISIDIVEKPTNMGPLVSVARALVDTFVCRSENLQKG